AEAYQQSFRTGSGQPRISMDAGVYAVEASAPEYSLWTRNVKKLDVTCAPIPRDKLVQLVTADIHYSPWYEDQEKQLDWAGLGVVPRKHALANQSAKNKWEKQKLRFAEMCGGNGRGVYLAEADSSEIGEQYWRHRRLLANVTDLGVLLKSGTT